MALTFANAVTRAKKALAMFDNEDASADTVAEYLRSKGVKGARGRATKCAVANWLSVESGMPYVAGITQVSPRDRGDLLHEMPSAVTAFIDHFDSGRYSDLIDRDQEGYEVR